MKKKKRILIFAIIAIILILWAKKAIIYIISHKVIECNQIERDLREITGCNYITVRYYPDVNLLSIRFKYTLQAKYVYEAQQYIRQKMQENKWFYPQDSQISITVTCGGPSTPVESFAITNYNYSEKKGLILSNQFQWAQIHVDYSTVFFEDTVFPDVKNLIAGGNMINIWYMNYFPNLETASIGDSMDGGTERHIENLEECPNLKKLNAFGYWLTLEQYAALREKLPNCEKLTCSIVEVDELDALIMETIKEDDFVSMDYSKEQNTVTIKLKRYLDKKQRIKIVKEYIKRQLENPESFFSKTGCKCDLVISYWKPGVSGDYTETVAIIK